MTSDEELTSQRKRKPKIVEDIIDAIHNDDFMYICVWGNGRTGKSSFCMGLAYHVYKDWNKVLGANVFNLSTMLYNLREGIPERWPVIDKPYKMRVPFLNWDDFAAQSGKAKTQHEKGWDIFKGGFDAITTKIAVLVTNMIRPTSPTQQLQEKYTHEVWLPTRGHYKYDTVTTRQDYRGWGIKQKKDWLDWGNFPPIPKTVYQEYDEVRTSLGEEVLQQAEDVVVETNIHRLKILVKPIDVTILNFISERGVGLEARTQVYQQELKEAGQDIHRDVLKTALIRLKARGLIVPIRKSQKYYKYDLTPLGAELLVVKTREQEEIVKGQKMVKAITV